DRLDVPWRVLLRFDPKRQLGRRERVERKPAVVVGLDRSKRRLTAIARRGIREIERDGARAVSERPGDLGVRKSRRDERTRNGFPVRILDGTTKKDGATERDLDPLARRAIRELDRALRGNEAARSDDHGDMRPID